MHSLTTATEQECPSFDRNIVQAMGPYLVCKDPPLYLSAAEFSDIPEMVRVLNIDKDIFNGTASFQYPYKEEHAWARITRAHETIKKTGFNTHWAMRTTPDGPLIGWIHAYINPDLNEVHPGTGRPLKIGEIGYWVSPEYVRKGYASLSAKFVVHELLFKVFDCDIVRGEAYIHNKASRKVLENTGMVCELEEMTVYIPKLQERRISCAYAIHRDKSTESVKTKPRPLP
ncbi:hypothetical protein BX616_003754 [Lobosporangium transversale]|uniref:Acyl-CoA N-acyltransferase n=1 Tax=Lobosporangium transversale TaxID=64571 RepID=A0A1Y2GZH3_9FUNG|nr:acyl-CoA N-acyltransferase [Lobosporangium transversale]KAF9916435.1 hypothetical protein BX616_003754 [Lobosporangium transversale]ORZ27151.1 acyl-CoA N-acyltransferase [Lobosporangium transversale]|eukprot:XP_021884898.1 acyl-CoA N-acyltransferase [Lobosporangium transversale]